MEQLLLHLHLAQVLASPHAGVLCRLWQASLFRRQQAAGRPRSCVIGALLSAERGSPGWRASSVAPASLPRHGQGGQPQVLNAERVIARLNAGVN